MRTTLFILIILFLSGCSSNIRYLKGNFYHDYNGFGGETITFDDSSHFHYLSITDDLASRCIGEGTYKIFNDTLQLNFDINKYDKPFNYIKIDSINTDSSFIYFDIYFRDSYTLKPIQFGIVTIFNSNNSISISDTADINGHCFLKLSKLDEILLIQTSFIKNSKSNHYYKTIFKLETNRNYKISIFSISHEDGNYYDGETINYKIEYLSKKSFEIKDKFDKIRNKKFILIDKQ